LGDFEVHVDEREIVAHFRRSEPHQRNHASGFAAHLRLSCTFRGKQWLAGLIEQYKPLEYTNLLRMWKLAEGVRIAGRQMRCESVCIFTARGYQSIRQCRGRCGRARHGDLSRSLEFRICGFANAATGKTAAPVD
jgi:hypothetical protein